MQLHRCWVAFIVLLNASVFAQLNSLPTCAQTCFASGVGGCASADIACICQSTSLNAITCCVSASCSTSDIDSTTNFARTLCSGAGITIDTNPSCANSPASAASSVARASSTTSRSPLSATSQTVPAQASVSSSILIRASSSAARSEGSASSTASSAPNTGQGSLATETTSQSGGLSTGAKIAIGVVIPIVFIAVLALVFFLLRRRKKSQRVGEQHLGVAETATNGTVMPSSGLMLAEGDDNEKQSPQYGVQERYDVGGYSAASWPREAVAPYSHAPNQDVPVHEADSGAVSTAYAQQHPVYQPQPHVNELAGAAVSPVTASEMSDNDRFTHPRELYNHNDWSQTHEMGTPSRAMSTYSESQTLAGDQGDTDEYLQALKAKRAKVAEEQERLRRMELLREEDERLEQAIEEYERRKGVK
ncbi:hypothetical protein ACN47E_005492 [Coniothyrium glycines]